MEYVFVGKNTHKWNRNNYKTICLSSQEKGIKKKKTTKSQERRWKNQLFTNLLIKPHILKKTKQKKKQSQQEISIGAKQSKKKLFPQTIGISCLLKNRISERIIYLSVFGIFQTLVYLPFTPT